MTRKKRLLLALVLAFIALVSATAVIILPITNWETSWIDASAAALIALIGAVIGYVIGQLGIVEIRIRSPRRRGD